MQEERGAIESLAALLVQEVERFIQSIPILFSSILAGYLKINFKLFALITLLFYHGLIVL